MATDEGEATTAAPSKTVEQGEVGGTLMDNVRFLQTFRQSNNISYTLDFTPVAMNDDEVVAAAQSETEGMFTECV